MTKPKKRPNRYWKNQDNLVLEVGKLQKKYPDMNIDDLLNEGFLYKNNLSTMAVVIRTDYDGLHNFKTKILNISEDEINHPKGYWKKLENRVLEAEELCDEDGNLPSIVEVRRINPSLAGAIVEHDGGIKRFRSWFKYIYSERQKLKKN